MGRYKPGKNKAALNKRRLLPLEDVAYWMKQGEMLVKYKSEQEQKSPHNEIVLLGAIVIAAIQCYDTHRGKETADYSHRSMYTLCREALFSDWEPLSTWVYTKEQMLRRFMDETSEVNVDQHKEDAAREFLKESLQRRERKRKAGLYIQK